MKPEVISEAVKNSETLKTIYERRAVRKYKDKPVDKEIIEQILDAGRIVPSAINRQSWKFYVIMKKETIQSFSKEIAKNSRKRIFKNWSEANIKNCRSSFASPA